MTDMQAYLASKPLIGMIHLPALPGSPRGTLDLDALVEFIECGGGASDEAAYAEAVRLARA